MNHWNWNEGKGLLDHSANSLGNADSISTVCSGCSVQSLKDLSNWSLRLFPKGKTFLSKSPQCFSLPSDVSTLKQASTNLLTWGIQNHLVMRESIGMDFLENSMPLAFFCLFPFPAFTPGFACSLEKDWA